LNGGIEHLFNGGEIDGNVVLVVENDVFINMLKVGHKVHHGLVLGEIFMGEGNDIFVGGKFHESISDQAGKDSYRLGAGDDDFHAAASTGSGDAFTDTVDGGAGIDWYNASGAAQNLKINLDSKSHFDPLLNYTHAANLATDVGGGDIGNDKVTNFENVDGGSGGDSIFGNAAANVISGNGGGDNLFGLGGNDILNGGAGQDDLFGGIGADQLNGGGPDGVLDRFRYTSLTDSLPSAPDTIIGFEDGKDLIDLSGLNIATLGLIGVDQEFASNSPGDVRVMTTLSGWLIQVDAGTDGVVDLAIKVADASHNINWTTADFDFV
jgi:Ca2+-binding RTX toxin-like protein